MVAPKTSKTHIGNHQLHPETLMLAYGFDPELSEGAVKPPVFLTSTFVFKTAEEGRDFFDYVSGRKEPPGGAGGGSRLFALQPSQQRDRRGPARRLRGGGGLHRVLVGHVGDRHDPARLRAAGRRRSCIRSRSMAAPRRCSPRRSPIFGIGAVGFADGVDEAAMRAGRRRGA